MPIFRQSSCLLYPVIVLLGILVPESRILSEEPGDGLGAYVDFIKPVFKDRCYACHGALKQKAGLRLDTAELIRSGADGDMVVHGNDPGRSELVRRLRAGDPDDRMPPEGEPIGEETIRLIEKWIAAGSPGPVAEKPEADPAAHWAFQPPEAPALPAVDGADGNPVDLFLARKYREAGIIPVERAPEETLVRRIYLDLLGLPPTREDFDAYFSMPEATRWDRLVDQLLLSPHYGERWGRHWMDVWRYSDWYGLGEQLRYSQKHIWHWRDWIIESLNDDKGYDRMIVEMLAGDELAPGDPDTLRATGFLARNYYLFNRTTWLDMTIEHVGKGFLGLTLNCAKCHDHKYDPVSQKNYYQFRAIFEPHQIRLDPVPGHLSVESGGIPRAFDAHPEAATYLHIRGDEKNPDTGHPIEPGLPEIIAGPQGLAAQRVSLKPEEYYPGIRRHVLDDRLAECDRRIESLRERIRNSGMDTGSADSRRNELARLEMESALQKDLAERSFRLASWEAERERVFSGVDSGPAIEAGKRAVAAWKNREMTLVSWQVAAARLELHDVSEEQKADIQHKLDKALEKLKVLTGKEDWPADYPVHRPALKALESPAETEESRRKPFPDHSTGRRLALARWIASNDNPLTARVAVNHVWMRHFGEPLVPSVEDFGRRQPSPELQDLLDFLAVDFMESGWHLKDLHRIILTSEAWRRGGMVPQDHPSHTADPDNSLFWKRNPVRMESQVIRDSVLHLASALDLSIGGPSVKADAQGPPHRRSLYFLHSRDDQNPFLVQFDDADIERCYRRDESIIPQQALAMANSSLTLNMAARIAANILEQSGGRSIPVGDFIREAFLTVLGRAPMPDETRECIGQLQELPDERARIVLIHALLNHNDFITIR